MIWTRWPAPDRPRRAAALALLLAAALWSAGVVAAEPPPAAPDSGLAPAPQPSPEPAAPPEPEKGEEITFHASEIRLLAKEQAAVLHGSAWVSCRGVLIEAEDVVVFRKRRQAYATGAVRLTEKGGRFLADDLFYDFGVHRARATGVRLEIGRIQEVPAESAAPGSASQAAPATGRTHLYEDWSAGAAWAMPRKWYINAPEIRRAGPGKWILVRPAVSSCEFQDPHWRFQCSSADYYPGRGVQSFNNLLYLGPLPIFYFPYAARDLAHDYPWTTWQFGKSDDWGLFALSKWGFDLPSGESWPLKPRQAILDLDWRQDRGMAYGADLLYDAQSAGGGRLSTYFLEEDHVSAPEDLDRAEDEIERRERIYERLRVSGAPKVIGRPKLKHEENLLFAERRAADGFEPPDLAPDLYAEELRRRTALSHRQDLLPLEAPGRQWPIYALDLSVEFQDVSDRDVFKEYFRSEYRAEPEPVSYGLLRHQGDAFSAALVYQPRMENFQSQTEYLPELRLAAPPRRLPGGFFLSGSAAVSDLRRRFDVDSGFEDLDAARARARTVLSRLVRLGPLAFNPYAGTDQAWYSASRAEEGDLVRGAFLYGADAGLPLYGYYDAESDRLNVHGLRHVVEPRVFYRGVSEPTRAPQEVLDFDAAEDLTASDVLGAGLSQRLQARRRDAKGAERAADLFGVDFEVSGLPQRDQADRLNEGDRLLPMKIDSFLSPAEWLRLWARQEIDAHGVGLSRTAEGLSLSHERALRLTVSHHQTAADPERDIRGSNEMGASLDAALSPVWRLGAASQYEIDKPDRSLGEQGLDNLRLMLVRELHCLRLALDFNTDVEDGRRRHFYGLTLTLAGRPVNLVKASDQLPVGDPDYSRAPWLPPAEEMPGLLRLVPPEEPPAPPSAAPEESQSQPRRE